MKLGMLSGNFYLCCGATRCTCGKKERAGYNPPLKTVKRPNKPTPAPPPKKYDEARQ